MFKLGAIKNWKTFVIGLLMAVLVFLQSQEVITTELLATLEGVGLFLISFFAKDADQTGNET